jgi:hypothetical protein
MYDAGKVIVGLFIFLALVTSPLWFNAMTEEEAGVPELKPPPRGETACVKDGEWMRASHMDLLNEWRDEVVRNADRWYTFTVGEEERTVAKSLTLTCLDCHSNKDEFCDTCHDYMAVAPYCWDCHVETKEAL